MKKRCAKEALQFIKNGMIVGLGGGSTISYLVQYIKENNLDIKVVTPSFQTENLCIENGLTILPLHSVDHVDVAFDGCDEVDKNLCALKSGGGIHTKEKIIGSMASEYILLVDESKVYDTLGFDHPVVLEIVKDSYSSVKKQVTKLKGNCTIRQASNKDGGLLSDQGLLLVDVTFNKEDVKDIKELHDALRAIVGVLEISIFYHVATKVLVIQEEGYKIIQ